MKLFKIILFILIFSNCHSQPGFRSNASVQIKSMFRNDKQLFKKGDGSIQFHKIYLVNTNGMEKISMPTLGSLEKRGYEFIYENDTMRVKLVLPEYYRLSNIRIKRFNFVKGNYIIDLHEFIENTNNIEYGYLIINNFPEDCLPYRKEEKE